MSTRPVDAASRPAMMRSVVDLPQPDGPSSTQNVPDATARAIRSRATVSPQCMPTPASWMELIRPSIGRGGDIPMRVAPDCLAGTARTDCRRTKGHAMDSAIRRQTIADLLRRTAQRAPDKPGLICGSACWTFAQFDAVVDRVAAGLSQMGIGHASRVAVLARNSHAFAALRFALARLGAVLVPINFMLKAEEVAYILKHAQAQMLATDSGLADLARSAAAMDTAVKQ